MSSISPSFPSAMSALIFSNNVILAGCSSDDDDDDVKLSLFFDCPSPIIVTLRLSALLTNSVYDLYNNNRAYVLRLIHDNR